MWVILTDPLFLEGIAVGMPLGAAGLVSLLIIVALLKPIKQGE